MGAVKHRVARPITAYGALGDYNTFVPENRLLFRLALVPLSMDDFATIFVAGRRSVYRGLNSTLSSVGWRGPSRRGEH